MRGFKMTMSQSAPAFAIILGMTAIPPVAAGSDETCNCWYQGYEDSTEFAPEEMPKTGGYQQCSNIGAGGAYAEGFRAGVSQSGKKCPYASSPT